MLLASQSPLGRAAATAAVSGLSLWHALVLGLLASTAFTAWPGLHHDAAFYTTPIINFASSGRWEFDGYTPGLVEFGHRRFDMHGQLYQVVFGKIFRISSYESLFRWTAGLNVLTYCAYLLIAWRHLSRINRAAGPWLAAGVAGAAALACLYLQGRPENIIPLLILLPFGLREWSRSSAFARRTGYVVLGLVILTSPVPGFLCLMGVLAWIALRHRETWLKETFSAVAYSIPAALLVLLASGPHHPVDWFRNTFALGSTATGFFYFGIPMTLGVFGYPSILELPYWNVFVLGVFGLLAVTFVKRRQWIVLVPYLIVFVGVLIPRTLIYSFFGFVPVIMLALAGSEGRLLAIPERIRKFPVVWTGVFSMWVFAGLTRTVLLALLFLRSGSPFERTQVSVRELTDTIEEQSESIGFVWLARPSFVAFSTPENFLVAVTLNVADSRPDPYLERYERDYGTRLRYVLLPQLGHITEAPASLNNGMFRLEENDWSTKRARIFGLKLGGAMPGYQFALYRRRDDPDGVPPAPVVSRITEHLPLR